MKKVCLFSLVLALCSISFFGCKNFMESEDFLTQLNDAVKYSNAPYAYVEIKADSHAILSIMPAVGEYNSHFKAGDKITLKFEEQEAYSFVEWRVTPENAVVFDDAKDRSTKATIISVEEPIVIEAYTVLRDKLQVKFDWEQGSVSAPSSSSFYLDEEFSFRYNGIADYAFVRWEVTDGTGIVRDDVLELSGDGIDVTAKVLKVNENVTIKAVTSKRPKVVSNSPLYNSDGVYRDRRIVVMFDRDMDESSIYYDADEQEKLKADGKKPIFDTAEGRTDKCYAYTDKDGLHWKNITIELRRIGTRYEEYYNAPYFDENDNSVLYIDPNQDNPPPGGKEILITLSQKMCAYDNGTKNKIELSNECGWAYFTNGSIDKFGPSFAQGFAVTFTDTPEVKNIKIEDKSLYESLRIKKTKIKMHVEGSYIDDGAGPGNLKWQIVKLPSPICDVNGEEIVENGLIENIRIEGKRADVDDNTYVDLPLSNIGDGLFRIDVIAYDVNEKPTRFNTSYYFIKDDKNPGKPTVFASAVKKGVKISVDISNVADNDVKEVVINNGSPIAFSENKKVKSVLYSSGGTMFSNGELYYFNIKLVDFAGNESETVTVTQKAGIRGGEYYCRNTNNEMYFTDSPNQDDIVLGKVPKIYCDDAGYIVDEIIGEKVRIIDTKFYTPKTKNDQVYSERSFHEEYTICENDNGYAFYNAVLNNSEYISKYPLINELYEGINDYNKSSVKWYIPSVNELSELWYLHKSELKNNCQPTVPFEGESESGVSIISSTLRRSGTDSCILYAVSFQRTIQAIGSYTKPTTANYTNGGKYSILLMAQVDPTK